MKTMDSKMLDWALLRSFLAVIDDGSLLRAAKRLGTYQPTLSRQIAELEAQLGVPLFERTGRGLTPTVAGLKIVAPARRMAEAARALQSTVLGPGPEKRATVRIACSHVVATYLLPACLGRLRVAQPTIQIDLVVSNELSNLLRREADIALRMVRPTQSSLTTRRVANIEFGLFASKRYLRRRGRPSNAEHLLEHDLIGQDRDTDLIRVLQSANLAVVRDSFAVRTDDQVTHLSLIAHDVGIGFAPCYVGRQLPAVERVLTSLPVPSLPIWLTVHREIKSNWAIRAVYDFLGDDIKTSFSAVGINDA